MCGCQPGREKATEFWEGTASSKAQLVCRPWISKSVNFPPWGIAGAKLNAEKGVN